MVPGSGSQLRPASQMVYTQTQGQDVAALRLRACLISGDRPGHRFGVVEGWRREYWGYNDQGTSDINASVESQDNVTSTVPFVGLCAEMAYPGWRSTFEFLTSRFISKNINGSVRHPGNFWEYHGAAQDGVLLEGRIQGMANITSNLFLGLYGRYSYQTYVPAQKQRKPLLIEDKERFIT